MFKALFSNRLFIGGVLILLVCTVVSVYFLRTDAPEAPVKIYRPVAVEKPPEPSNAEAPVEDTSQGGHVHEDGTFHAEPHEIPAETPVQHTAPPGAATKPNFPSVDPSEDPVEAAYKRLEYIKNNPYAWGGVHSPRATELIAELMPPPILVDHAHGDQINMLMEELLVQGDPRAAEVIITTLCDGSMGTRSMDDALVEIGPPAVPYILPYLEKGVEEGEYIRLAVFDSLGRIGERYRSDLGGIVEHIIIPKFEAIAADDNDEDFDEKYARFSGAVIFAREALERLQ